MISSTMWLPLLPALTATHHVRMLDAVGDLNRAWRGRLDPRVVEWIDEVLDTLQIGHTALVGLSFGSWMATQYAMRRPDRIERLAILAPAGIVSRQHLKWLVEMTFKVQLRPTPARVERAFDTFVMEQTRRQLREDPWRPIVQQFIVGSMSFRRNSRELRPVRCNIERLAGSGIPVLALIPRAETLHDGSTMAERFRQQLPHAQVELVDDANHLILIDQPEVVTEQLTKFSPLEFTKTFSNARDLPVAAGTHRRASLRSVADWPYSGHYHESTARSTSCGARSTSTATCSTSWCSRAETRPRPSGSSGLLKGLQYMPRVMVTDKLASYGVAHRESCRRWNTAGRSTSTTGPRTLINRPGSANG